MAKKLRIGQIPYLNSVLFYHLLARRDDMSLEPLVPRQLSGAVVEDAVDAGPVPLVTCWDIQSRYEPLDDFAIATIAKTRSIFLDCTPSLVKTLRPKLLCQR